MSSSWTIPYTTDTNYTFDSAKIEVSSGTAKLIFIDYVAQTFNQAFAADTGFTYDSAKAEFTGGLVQQIDQRPTDATFGAKLDTTGTANWGDGTLTPHAFNGSIVGGWAELPLNNRLRYNNSGNMDSLDTGTIVFRLRTDYTGTPSSNQRYIEICSAVIKNRITIRHLSVGGTLLVEFYDQNSLQQIATSIGWSPTTGNEYEILISWDLRGVSDFTNVYINKTRNATLSTTGLPCVRDSDVSNQQTQVYAGGAGNIGLAVKDWQYFSTVQENGASYVTDYTATAIPEADYLSSTVELPQFSYPGVGVVQSFDTFTTTDANAPQYVMNDLYWTGSAWASSDGSWAQSNTEADVSTNILALPASDTLNVDVLFNQNNGTQMNCDNLTTTYTGQIYPTDDPTILTNSVVDASEFLTFVNTVIETGSDLIKHVIQVDGQDKWNNAGTVENSNGTYAESNTAAEITAEIADFVTARSLVKIKSFLHSDDGSTYPELDLITITFDASLPDPTLPTKVDVNGFIYDINGPVASLVIQARPYQAGYSSYVSGSGVFHYYKYDTVATTDSDGYFSGYVYMQPTGKYLEFKVGSQSYYTELPDQASVDFSTLTLTLVEYD